MLGQLQQDGVVVCDLEAGVGTLLRMEASQVDIVLVVVEPSLKSIEAGKRAAQIAAQRSRVVVVANRVKDDADTQLIRSAIDAQEFVMVPDDTAITEADRAGKAPIDVAPEGAAVAAIIALAGQLGAMMDRASESRLGD